ncbi:hypothetical protein [Wenxinia saemankumensis]|uniref:SGNH/GDSL hydrolase family protein n=1 Tax=Wenxinia saemankumensis TaxID=1447782 RepID=A0A1M6CWM0_9RHOB|nr:hypothetical protein [Wenxinia saemankumensis]SHI65128.1 hypothetical protein SAMN05444417_1393 [Wenxinia saemankumensis]
MTTLFLGNSHLGAIEAAWSADPRRWPDLAPRFTPFRGTAVREVAVAEGALRPAGRAAAAQFARYHAGRDIPLEGLRAVVVVGFNVKPHHVLALWREARWPGLPSLAGCDLAGLDRTFLSREAARSALAGYLGGLAGFDFASRLAATGRWPVLLVGHPRLSEAAPGSARGRALGLPRALTSGDAPALSALYEGALAAAAARAGVIALPQPPATIRRHLLTGAAYMAGEIEVDDPAGGRRIVPDISHPSAEYGALVLDAVTARIAR